MKNTDTTGTKARIGISSCLLGHPVRYDGQHKRHDFVVNKLGRYFDFVPVCPETGIGMPVPRPPVQLVRMDGGIRVKDVETHQHDYTNLLQQFPFEIAPVLETLAGFVLKKNSPSCGLFSVKVYSPENNQIPVAEDGSGQFALSLQAKYPLLPVEEEGRLTNPQIRMNFILRTRVYSQWLMQSDLWRHPVDLKRFHADYARQISRVNFCKSKRLDGLVSRASCAELDRVKSEYIHELMQLLKTAGYRGQQEYVFCK